MLRQRSPRRPDLCIASVPALRSVLDIPGHPHVPHSRVRRVPQSQMLFPSKRRPSRKTAHAFEWCSALTLAAHLFPALCAPPTKDPESESRGFSRGETAALSVLKSRVTFSCDQIFAPLELIAENGLPVPRRSTRAMLGRWTGRALAAGVRSAGRGVSGWPDPNDLVPRDIAAAGVECTEGDRPVQPSCPLLLVCSLDRPKLESGGLRAISGSSEVPVLPNIHLCTGM